MKAGGASRAEALVPERDGFAKRLFAAWRDPGTVLRYAAVGGSSAFTEFVIFNGLVYLASFSVLAANLVATLCVIAFSFISHKHFTFRNKDGYGRQLVLFVAMLGVSVLLNNGLVYLFAVTLGWPPPLAKILQLGICFFWNFSCSRLVVFAVRQRS
jgi:putative flippase GtrA